MKKYALAAVLLALLYFSFSSTNAFSSIYPAISLRYENPFTQAQIDTALEYSAENGTLELAFGGESTAAVSFQNKAQSSTVIRFLGDGGACFPAVFVRGGYAGDRDAFCCSVSTQLAWQLFGSDDIVGQNVQIDDKSYEIRGVFKNDENVCVTGADSKATLTNAEISGTTPTDRRTQALNFAKSAGFGAPKSMVYGESMAALANLAAWLPLFMAACFMLCAVFGKISALPQGVNGVAIFAAALCFALLLPFILAEIPAWLIPAKWSDFTFWTTLWQTLGDRIKEWFSLAPCIKDVAAKGEMLRLTIFTVAACGCAVNLRKVVKFTL